MFPKKYNYHEIESKIQKLNDKYQLSHTETITKLQSENGATYPCSADEVYVSSFPPPNVTGVLHLGHALTTSMEDIIMRYHRMTGKSTLWLPGTDHAGIATQTKVEAKLKLEEDKIRFDYGRVAFLEKVWDFALANRETIISQTKLMGASLDWSRESFTLSEKLSRAVRKAFVTLHTQGKIYQGHRVTNRDPVSQSVISDIEVIMKEQDSKLYYIKYFVTGGQSSITVATTRPDTVIADVAIAVNPGDKRFKGLVGKFVIAPITNRKIPVIADDYVDPTFGTGALKITPSHDANDYEIAVRHNLPIDIIAFDKEGKYSEHAGEFVGIHMDDGFENLVNIINERGNLVKVEDYTNKVPTSERTGAIIQPIITQQWFYDTSIAAQASTTALTNGQMEIFPARFEQDFHQWMEKIQPRCISRQLWRGHRIPVRSDSEGISVAVDEDYILEQHDDASILTLLIFNLVADSRLTEEFTLDDLIALMMQPSIVPHEGMIYQVYQNIYHTKFADRLEYTQDLEELIRLLLLLTIEPSNTTTIDAIADLISNTAFITEQGDGYRLNMDVITGLNGASQDPDVLDTWFSSGLWPMTTLGRPEATTDYTKFFPQTMLETGGDIIFFWVARMCMMSYDLTGQMPFRDIVLHGMVLDEKGKKQSKSAGNGVDPLQIIEQYGADTMRIALVTGSTPGTPLKIGTDKFDQYSRFINKFWNASRYVSIKIIGEDTEADYNYEAVRQQVINSLDQSNDFDRWILSGLDSLITKQHEFFATYQVGEFSQQLINFVRNQFCDRYIETSKQIHSPLTDMVMIYSIATLCKLLHPYIPHVTEQLWHSIGMQGWITIQPIALPLGNIDNNIHIETLMTLISECRTLRNQAKVPNHEKVTILVCINHDFAQLLRQYEDLIFALVKSDGIIYHPTMQREETSGTILSTMLYDMKLGIQTHVPQLNRKDHLLKLQTELSEEQRFMVDIKRSLSSPEFIERAPPHIVQTKRDKLNELKIKIEQLNIEIETIKMNNK